MRQLFLVAVCLVLASPQVMLAQRPAGKPAEKSAPPAQVVLDPDQLIQEAKKFTAGDVLALERRAARGDVRSRFLLGFAYEFGYGVKKDLAAALRWFRAAAEQGNAAAEDWVGDFYHGGVGIPVDHTAAFGWYRRAAKKEYRRALYNLGTLYLFGLGTPRDYQQALQLTRRAAEKGWPSAKARLVFMDPPCADQFCIDLQSVVIARDSSFYVLSGNPLGPSTTDEDSFEVTTTTRYAAKLLVAGAEECYVEKWETTDGLKSRTGNSYVCRFGTALPEATADQRFSELQQRIRASYPPATPFSLKEDYHWKAFTGGREKEIYASTRQKMGEPWNLYLIVYGK